METRAKSGDLLEGTVRDIMQSEVLTVAPDLSVRELTRVLSEEAITGAPVVGTDGTLLGVVSTSDITRMAASEPGTMVSLVSMAHLNPAVNTGELDEEDEAALYGDFFLPEETTIPVWGPDESHGLFDDLTVEQIMTDMAFTVHPDLSIRELAEFLLRGRIHRAVVTEDSTLVGIVTTMDILRAVTSGS